MIYYAKYFTNLQLLYVTGNDLRVFSLSLHIKTTIYHINMPSESHFQLSNSNISSKISSQSATSQMASKNDEAQWFVLKVSHREQKAQNVLEKAGVTTFCPMTKTDITVRGEKAIVQRPLIANTVFAYGSFSKINSIKNTNSFITYCYAKSGSSYKILHVPEHEMVRFIDSATKMQDDIAYYRPDEIDLKRGDRVRIVGGLFDGYEGVLLKAKGRAKRMFLINFEMLGALGTHVEPEYIRLVKNK